jgi:hypothetical protein
MLGRRLTAADPSATRRLRGGTWAANRRQRLSRNAIAMSFGAISSRCLCDVEAGFGPGLDGAEGEGRESSYRRSPSGGLFGGGGDLGKRDAIPIRSR